MTIKPSIERFIKWAKGMCERAKKWHGKMESEVRMPTSDEIERLHL